METLLYRSDLLQRYNHYVGDPGYLTQDLNRYRTSSPEKVQEVAARFLKPDARVEVLTQDLVGVGSEEKTLPWDNHTIRVNHPDPAGHNIHLWLAKFAFESVQFIVTTVPPFVTAQRVPAKSGSTEPICAAFRYCRQGFLMRASLSFASGTL